MGIYKTYKNNPLLFAINEFNELDSKKEENDLALLSKFYELLDVDYFSRLDSNCVDDLLGLIMNKASEVVLKRERCTGKSTILAYYMSLVTSISKNTILFVAPNVAMMQIVVPIVMATNIITYRYSDGIFIYENGSRINLCNNSTGTGFLRGYNYDIMVVDEESKLPSNIDLSTAHYAKKVSTITIESIKEEENEYEW